MVAKLLVDVKAIFWAKYCAGATASEHSFPDFLMISSPDRTIPTLPPVRLCALLLYADRNGTIIRDCQGFIGEIIDDDAVSLSEGSVWIMTNGPRNAEVFQTFVFFNPENVLNHPEQIRNPKGIDLGDVNVAVTGFAAHALGLKRANEHAQTRAMQDINLWRRLITMSDDVLMFAIGTNLNRDIDVTEHEQNCNTLIEFANSEHPLAKEVRAFLKEMRNPRDIRNRKNVYRMVLIVRAIQRRALEIAEGKHDTLAAILFQKQHVEEWVGIVVQRASRMAVELQDKQPWWLGIEDSLPRGIGQQRVTNFVHRLNGYIEELERVYAKPFQPWAARAANAMRAMVTGLKGKRYNGVSENARKAVAALQAITLREQISIAILLTAAKNQNDRERVLGALQNARLWARDAAPVLGITPRAAPILDVLNTGNDGEWESLERTLRAIEQTIDSIN